MATQNLIQIKRSETTSAPLNTDLSAGELAWSGNSSILYIGDFGTTVAIGGQYLVDGSNISVTYGSDGKATIDLANTVSFDSLTLGGVTVSDITTDIAVSALNGELATASSIKTYVDNQVGGVVSSFTLDADIGTNDTFNTGETLSFNGANGVSTTVSNNAIQFDAIGSNGISVDTNGINVQAANSTVSVTASGIAVDTTNIPFPVTSVTGTTNEVTVLPTTGDVVVGLPDDVTVANTLTVGGDLIVNGTTTTLNTTQLNVEDNLIVLASNNSTDLVDFGFYGQYNDGTEKYSGLIRDASDAGTYKLLEGITTEPTGSTFTGGTLAALDVGALAASSLSLTTQLSVPNGGTGLNTVTTNAVVYGQGTSALAEATGTAYEILQLNASGVPVFNSLDGGTF